MKQLKFEITELQKISKLNILAMEGGPGGSGNPLKNAWDDIRKPVRQFEDELEDAWKNTRDNFGNLFEGNISELIENLAYKDCWDNLEEKWDELGDDIEEFWGKYQDDIIKSLVGGMGPIGWGWLPMIMPMKILI